MVFGISGVLFTLRSLLRSEHDLKIIVCWDVVCGIVTALTSFHDPQSKVKDSLLGALNLLVNWHSSLTRLLSSTQKCELTFPVGLLGVTIATWENLNHLDSFGWTCAQPSVAHLYVAPEKSVDAVLFSPAIFRSWQGVFFSVLHQPRC